MLWSEEGGCCWSTPKNTQVQSCPPAHCTTKVAQPARLKLPPCLLFVGAAQGNRSAHRTLRAWEVDVLSKANYWEQNKKQRMSEFEDLQVGAGAARARTRGRVVVVVLERCAGTCFSFKRVEGQQLGTLRAVAHDRVQDLHVGVGCMCGSMLEVGSLQHGATTGSAWQH